MDYSLGIISKTICNLELQCFPYVFFWKSYSSIAQFVCLGVVKLTIMWQVQRTDLFFYSLWGKQKFRRKKENVTEAICNLQRIRYLLSGPFQEKKHFLSLVYLVNSMCLNNYIFFKIFFTLFVSEKERVSVRGGGTKGEGQTSCWAWSPTWGWSQEMTWAKTRS